MERLPKLCLLEVFAGAVIVASSLDTFHVLTHFAFGVVVRYASEQMHGALQCAAFMQYAAHVTFPGGTRAPALLARGRFESSMGLRRRLD